VPVNLKQKLGGKQVRPQQLLAKVARFHLLSDGLA
jgi:hypothetical protein